MENVFCRTQEHSRQHWGCDISKSYEQHARCADAYNEYTSLPAKRQISNVHRDGHLCCNVVLFSDVRMQLLFKPVIDCEERWFACSSVSSRRHDSEGEGKCRSIDRQVAERDVDSHVFENNLWACVKKTE